MENRLKLAIQKKGRLTEKSLTLLKNCGLDFENYSERLVVKCKNFPLDILFLRDDDIPEYVQDKVADLGIVGENVFVEKEKKCTLIKRLGFGRCSLMLAIPKELELNSISELNGKSIATSYPVILQKFLKENNIEAKLVNLSGSVEIAPTLGVADLICDIVSTGNTLLKNKLKKSFKIFDSEAVLIKPELGYEIKIKNEILNELLIRIDSAQTAKESKYIMLNAPKNSLDKITGVIPALKSPTILPLRDESMVAVHAVIPSNEFWNIHKKLKEAGASDILLLPIDNIIY